MTTIKGKAFDDLPNLTDIYIYNPRIKFYNTSYDIVKNFGFSYDDEGFEHKSEILTVHGYAGTELEEYAEYYELKFDAFEVFDAGDINCDGSVDLKDVVMLGKYIAGGYNIELDEDTADLNGDGAVNDNDIDILRKFIAGGYNITLS